MKSLAVCIYNKVFLTIYQLKVFELLLYGQHFDFDFPIKNAENFLDGLSYVKTRHLFDEAVL